MSTDAMAQTIEEKMDKLIDSVNEMNITLKLNGKQLEQIPDLDNRVTALEHKQSRSEGTLSGMKIVGSLVGMFLVSAVLWVCQTTYKNDSNITLLLQRVGNVENMIHDAHK